MRGRREVSRRSRGEGEEEVSVPPGLLLWQLPLEKACWKPLIVASSSQVLACSCPAGPLMDIMSNYNNKKKDKKKTLRARFAKNGVQR